MDCRDNEDYLSEQEEKRFASLARTVAGNRASEDKTVGALRNMGMLKRSGGRARKSLVGLSALAAAAVLFFSGYSYGHHVALVTSRDVSPVGEVQRAGSAYVAALVKLTESGDRGSVANLAAGLEAGTSTLRAAASTAALLAPQDTVLGRIRDGLDLATDFTTGERSLIRY